MSTKHVSLDIYLIFNGLLTVKFMSSFCSYLANNLQGTGKTDLCPHLFHFLT